MTRPAALLPIAIVACLAAGIAGGLIRAGVPWPWLAAADAPWLGRAAVFHAFLMVSAFMGSVIGIERAVAVKSPAAFAAPVLSAVSGVATLAGSTTLGPWLAVGAAAAFVPVNIGVVRRQPAAHTALLLAGALAWLVGNGLFALARLAAAVPWWLAFLILTIAAERLEMTRLMRRRRGASPALAATLALLLAGAIAFAVSVPLGEALYGAALVALAAWLLAFDIARRTIRAQGLSRYMAACLLLGYAWLGVSGLAWIGMSLGLPLRDVALHALALGFVFSMMLGHAPVILPAVARVKLRFGWAFYVPLALLHATLLVRLVPGLADARWRALGAAGNAGAIVLFIATVVGAAIAWRVTHPAHRAAAPPDPTLPTP